jgi:hypothetical protein
MEMVIIHFENYYHHDYVPKIENHSAQNINFSTSLAWLLNDAYNFEGRECTL